jgi:hypothetical protein
VLKIRLFNNNLKLKIYICILTLKKEEMIKNLLIAAVTVLTVSANAQSGARIAKNNRTNSELSKIEGHSVTSGKSLPSTCYTVTTITGTQVGVSSAQSDTPAGCSPNAGFVFGSNCYDDKEKANFFPAGTYSMVTSPSVTAVRVLFYKNGTEGTSGTTMTVGITLYNGTSAASAPSTVISSTVATLANILAAQPSPTVNFFYYTFNFANPVVVPAGGFYTSVIIPTTAGDTAVIAAETSTAAAFANNAWEKWSDNSWYSIPNAWGGLKANLAIQPIICGNAITTAISKNLGLSKDVTIMPNPSTGLVNVSVALANSQDLTLTVTNALGQVIVNNNYSSVLTEVISLDLTNQSNGVYFVTVSNGKDKMVQRLILNK